MAERDLSTLLKTLTVKRHAGDWRFETISADAASWTDLVNLPGASSIAMLFMEDEGVSLILPATEETLAENRWAWLELSVYSDLQAVGFLARVAGALADADIPCNAVAAVHHDHIFVPIEKAERAIAALHDLRKQS